MTLNHVFKLEFYLAFLFSIACCVQLFIIPDKQNRGGMVAINYYDVLVFLFACAAILYLVLGIAQSYFSWTRYVTLFLTGVLVIGLLILSYQYQLFRFVNIFIPIVVVFVAIGFSTKVQASQLVSQMTKKIDPKSIQAPIKTDDEPVEGLTFIKEKVFEDFYSKYNLKPGERPQNLTIKTSSISGIEIWSVIQNASADPVHIEYWLSTPKGKYPISQESIVQSLKDLEFKPKSNEQALAAVLLFFSENRKTLVDETNISKIDVPLEIRSQLKTPVFKNEKDNYFVEVDIFYSSPDQKKFFGIDNRSIVRHRFVIGLNRFERMGYDEIWTANPPKN